MNNKQDLALVPPPNGDSQELVAMLERLALNPDVPVDKLERLLDMQERIHAKQAESEFNIALTAAQSEVGRISADAENPQTHSKFASYSKLDRVMRPIYTKHGFALSFGTSDPPATDMIRVICYLSHRAGHTRMYHVDMPADGKGPKGADVMTKTHAAGSAMSYGMRYLLKMMFNIAIGEDRDGNNPPVDTKTITERQVADLDALLSEVGYGDGEKRQRFLRAFKIGKLEDIPAINYAAVVRQVEAKRR